MLKQIQRGMGNVESNLFKSGTCPFFKQLHNFGDAFA